MNIGCELTQGFCWLFGPGWFFSAEIQPACNGIATANHQAPLLERYPASVRAGVAGKIISRIAAKFITSYPLASDNVLFYDGFEKKRSTT